MKTEDGYILSMQRIPEGRVAGDGGANRQPVLLQHGILMVYICIFIILHYQKLFILD